MHVIDGVRLNLIKNGSLISFNKISNEFVDGKICLTENSLVFLSLDGRREIRILYSLISSVEKLATTQHGSGLRVRTKHFLIVDFITHKEHSLIQLFKELTQKKYVSYDELICFQNQPENSFSREWRSCSLRTVFASMDIPNKYWRLEEGNQNFSLCETYPSILCVPSSVAKSILIASAKFRSRARLPVLTYLHKNAASITRCAQPLAGLNTRCQEDEFLLQCILKTNPKSSVMYIVDTRPRINAVVNRAAGKGYENEVHYENMQFKFCPIENIHVMRSSLQKLIEICETRNSTTNQFLTGLEECSWLKHIKAVMDAAIFIATAIAIENRNVLVHCSDGWDRTAQCCSLASLLLSEHHRTIHGFRTLIEKEWLAFGHKFSERCGHLASDHKEQSPVFLQFIEVVWNLTEIYPTAFEFNERFLIVLYENTQSCRFGNFIGNCERERAEMKVEGRTFSFWDFVLHRINDFRNPLFKPQSNYANDVLLPSLNVRNLRFWSNMYQRFDSSVLPRENLSKTILTIADHNNMLEDHARFLEKKIRKLSTNPENQSEQNLQLDLAKNEISSISTLWQNYNDPVQCHCIESIDSMQRKYNCWCCGKIFCVRCVNYWNNYPGLMSETLLAPLCQSCQRSLKSNNLLTSDGTRMFESSSRND